MRVLRCRAWFQVEVDTPKGNRRPARLRQLEAYVGLRSSVKPMTPSAGGLFRPPDRVEDPLAWSGIEVIGTFAGAADRERGYRIRLESGAEMTLIRERDGLWFVDEPPQ